VCVAVCCSVLQCVAVGAVCCRALLFTNINEAALFLNWIDADKIDSTNGTCVLQCDAVCCSETLGALQRLDAFGGLYCN